MSDVRVASGERALPAADGGRGEAQKDGFQVMGQIMNGGSKGRRPHWRERQSAAAIKARGVP